MNFADFHIYVPDHFLVSILCTSSVMAYSQRMFPEALLLLREICLPVRPSLWM
jgi:hypothetical protein